MKRKNLFLMFGFGVALLLGSCSQDEIENNEGGTAAQSVVCFSAGSSAEATRTSMDPDGTFYWTSGDYVFVKKGSDYIPSDNAATSRVLRQNFYLLGTFDDPTYPVVYTGNGKNQASEATSVEIKASQNQTDANDATHIGTDGDCGNATATKTGTGSYTFDIKHRAAYLIITPRHHDLPGDVVLKSVTVTTSGTDNLCGTYTFSENTTSLKDETNTGTGNLKTVSLTVGDWKVPTVDEVNADANKFDQVRGYMVIQPGTHTLEFTYEVTVGGTPRTFVKNVAAREFLAGYYTNVKHILADGLFNGGHTEAPHDPSGEINDDALNYQHYAGKHYQWGATDDYQNTYLTNAYNRTTVRADLTTTSPVDWASMPNANQAAWYVLRGDPRWDGVTLWSPDNGLTEYAGGVWILKKQHIPGFNAATDPYGRNLVNMTSTYYIVNSVSYRSGGRPDDSVISQYFYLPASGRYLENRSVLTAIGSIADFWLRSAYGSTTYAFHMGFDRNSCCVSYDYRYNGYVVAPEWFK